MKKIKYTSIGNFDINIIDENKITGTRKFECDYELLETIINFCNIQGKEFSTGKITNLKISGNKFTFTGGVGYNILDVDLFNDETGKFRKDLENYIFDLEKDKNIEMGF